MKHCPQCDFIYEDDQSVCDMDGKELVSDLATVATEPSFAAPVNPTSPISPISLMSNPVADASRAPVVQSANRRWRNFAVVTVVGFVLAALVIVLYVARARQLRTRRAPETAAPSTGQSAARPAAQSTSGATSGQPSSTDGSSQAPSGTLPEQAREASTELSSAQTEQAALSSASASREALAHTRLTPGPVSAGAPSGNSRGPVIVRLTNGAAIKADEVWEKREGIWYRQAGVVTFLKRSQVRKIEAAPAPAKSAPSNAQGRKTQNTAAPKPLRLAQLEPASPKKQSRLTSFLKKTGQVLKKPFKL